MGNRSDKYTAPADSTVGASGPVIIEDNLCTARTFDLWPRMGKDGRDYGLVGTWGEDGYGTIYNITDRSNIVKTDSIKIDACTINDATVSLGGLFGVLSRAGASNRASGVVILDLAVLAHPRIASKFHEQLTGRVHNMFVTTDYLFAMSAGQKFVISDVKVITKPKNVSEHQHSNARIHDLRVRNGIAYSARGGVMPLQWMWATANTAAPFRGPSSLRRRRPRRAMRSIPHTIQRPEFIAA